MPLSLNATCLLKEPFTTVQNGVHSNELLRELFKKLQGSVLTLFTSMNAQLNTDSGTFLLHLMICAMDLNVWMNTVDFHMVEPPFLLLLIIELLLSLLPDNILRRILQPWHGGCSTRTEDVQVFEMHKKSWVGTINLVEAHVRQLRQMFKCIQCHINDHTLPS
jgi:hypothetical protein